MPSLLAIDPGRASGWSFWRSVGMEDTPYERSAYGLIQGGLEGFRQWCQDWSYLEEATVVVCEDFILDGRTMKPDLSPCWIGGLIYGARPDTIWQPNTMKNTAKSDAILKKHGLWVTGKDVGWEDGRDCNDSANHALAWMKSVRHMPSLRLYWPET